MRDVLHLLADGLIALGTALSKRTRGFSEVEADRYLAHLCRAPQPFACELCPGHCSYQGSAAAGGEAAAVAAPHVGYPLADVRRAPGERPSELIFAAANQLDVLLRHSHFNHLRESYLEELIPELRELAREFVLQGD